MGLFRTQVMGVPNCGKSSLINALHSISQRSEGSDGKAGRGAKGGVNPAICGPLPGVTRHLSAFRVIPHAHTAYSSSRHYSARLPGCNVRVDGMATGAEWACAAPWMLCAC
eukprot:6373068-Pyramimonas_sp.AAC.2